MSHFPPTDHANAPALRHGVLTSLSQSAQALSVTIERAERDLRLVKVSLEGMGVPVAEAFASVALEKLEDVSVSLSMIRDALVTARAEVATARASAAEGRPV